MRTLLIGVDALDPALVDEFDLPNITGISTENDGFEVSTHGNSGPSWASVLTGLHPNDHGVFKLAPKQTRASWGGVPIWEKIDGYCGVANVPLTYPPDPDINGWMITGMMTPGKSIYTAPADLYRTLEDMGYRIDIWVESHQNHPEGAYGMVPFDFTQEWREDVLDECEAVLTKRGEVFEWLLTEHTPVDFAFLTFTTLDRMQHIAFDDKDEVRRFYELADEQVGKVLACVDDDVEVFLTSDHGFRALDEPETDMTGDHRAEGYGITNTGQIFSTLEDCHDQVVESANRSDVEGRLRDLGYIE